MEKLSVFLQGVFLFLLAFSETAVTLAVNQNTEFKEKGSNDDTS